MGSPLARQRVCRACDPSLQPRNFGQAVVIMSPHVDAVYHSVYEGMLRTLLVLPQLNKNPALRIVTTDKPHMLQFLRVLGIDTRRVVRGLLVYARCCVPRAAGGARHDLPPPHDMSPPPPPRAHTI